MHVPDGFLDPATTVLTTAVAGVALAFALRGTGRELSERTVPLAGLLAAFLFAVQLINVPLGIGTSVHILGVVFAAIVLGPCTALVCASVVLLVQSFVMGFGGVSGLGASMIVMDLVPILIGYGLFSVARNRLPASAHGVLAGVAAGLSAVAGAGTFLGLTLVGGADGISDVPTSVVAGSLLGSHVISGLIEGVITTSMLAALHKARPDLIRGFAPLSESSRPVVGSHQ
ncbi:MAG: energy-coupling factor ABC transporter permease [Corynebacteriales bacterium]|nr:energy-coupling factor ABC transporter permease [Mycobacteriales bacterium]